MVGMFLGMFLFTSLASVNAIFRDKTDYKTR